MKIRSNTYGLQQHGRIDRYHGELRGTGCSTFYRKTVLMCIYTLYKFTVKNIILLAATMVTFKEIESDRISRE